MTPEEKGRQGPRLGQSAASLSPDRPLLEVRGVRKSFNGVTALDGVELSVKDGEVVVILGRSGSGKSTLVRCIHQLTPIDAGAIYLDGELVGFEHSRGKLRPLGVRKLAQQRAQMGMVFQHFELFSHLTVMENITLAPVRVRGLSPAQAREAANELLEQVGLPGKSEMYPGQLSGGQQQRVAIARMLAMEPRLLLFDEPTSALDPELVGEVLAVMRKLTVGGRTMIVVTHEIQFAREVADRVVFFERGRIAAEGSVSELIDHPRSESMRSFLARVPKTAGVAAGEADRLAGHHGQRE